MSVRVMTAVWELSLPDSEKIVLLALADCANDEGYCWPSMATLTKKCSKSDRTIQTAIKSLVDAGHLTRNEVPGKGCNYTVHPRSGFAPKPVTPEAASPRNKQQGTPEAASDKPSRTIISSEAKASSDKRARAADEFPQPDWADAQVWKDFLGNRKAKKLRNTATAYAGLLRDIERLADAEWPPGRLLEYAAAKGWGGIYDPRDKDDRNVLRRAPIRAPQSSRAERLFAATRAAEAECGDGGDYPRIGHSLPS